MYKKKTGGKIVGNEGLSQYTAPGSRSGVEVGGVGRSDVL